MLQALDGGMSALAGPVGMCVKDQRFVTVRRQAIHNQMVDQAVTEVWRENLPELWIAHDKAVIAARLIGLPLDLVEKVLEFGLEVENTGFLLHACLRFAVRVM